MRVALQPSYILHSRPYRDSSVILEVFTAEQGRFSLVGKGARRAGRGGSNAALLQPFIPLLLSFSGRGEMKTLTQVERAEAALAPNLRGERLFSGLYVNELLMRLLHRHDPHPSLFAAYNETLGELSLAESVDAILRRFEFRLLDDLGYSFDLCTDGRTGEVIAEDGWYHYHPDYGMVQREKVADTGQPAYAGSELMLLSRGEYAGEARLAAKRLVRQALSSHLGDTPLKSRDLFRSYRQQTGEAE
jgi:DNA repair protein RecO (recombination protein O)